MAAVIEISPGPNFLLITRSVSRLGKSGAMACVSGFSCSYILHGTLAIFGVSALLATMPVILLIIQLTGACYLLYLGIKALMPYIERFMIQRPSVQPVDILLSPASSGLVMENTFTFSLPKLIFTSSKKENVSERNAGVDIVLDNVDVSYGQSCLSKCFRDGIVISAFNPKISLFYVAAFPQFILVDGDKVSTSYMLVFTHIVICALWALIVAFVLEYALNKTEGSQFVDTLDRVSGFALIGLSMAFFANAANVL